MTSLPGKKLMVLHMVTLVFFAGLECRAQYMGMTGGGTRNSYSGGFGGLENALNAVDTRQGWSRTPVSGAQQQYQYQQAPVYQQRRAPQPMYQQGRAPHAPAPGQMMNAMQGMFPGVSRQEMMRCFFEGGSPQMGGGMQAAPPPDQSGKTSTAYSNYQTACNEETKARNDANTARYNSDQWCRKDAATRAEYAANNAEYAAQRAESAAYSGDSQAQGYANLARQAANRARENANRARYNADTIR